MIREHGDSPLGCCLSLWRRRLLLALHLGGSIGLNVRVSAPYVLVQHLLPILCQLLSLRQQPLAVTGIGLDLSECVQGLLDPVNEGVAHQVETQVHTLQVNLVLVFVTATSYDEVQQKLTRLKPETVLCKVEVFNTSAQTHRVG